MRKSMGLLLLCLLLVAIPAALIAPHRGAPAPTLLSVVNGEYWGQLNSHIAESLPFQQQLRRFNLRLGLLGGQQEQNDIFLAQQGLIKNIDAANPSRVQHNTDAILRFAQQVEVPTFLTLLPTSSAILQEQLPPFAELYNNQKQLIDGVYQQMAGQVTVMDVYPTLFNRRNQYIYYRTENNLTPLGGYYVYTMLSAKLVRETHELSQFHIEYLPQPFYGDLYQKSPYPGVRADILSLYQFTSFSREYLITHHLTNGSSKIYHTLYPTHLVDLDGGCGVYLGGISGVVDLQISSPYPRSLLVFGDKTTLSFLPFLANHYERITVVDLFQITQAQAKEVHPQDYDQILFAYSVETFSTDIPMRAESLLH